MNHRKLGFILENKALQTLKLLKKVNTKKWSCTLFFLNDKNILENQMTFEFESQI